MDYNLNIGEIRSYNKILLKSKPVSNIVVGLVAIDLFTSSSNFNFHLRIFNDTRLLDMV